MQEESGDTKEVIRIRKSKKYRQHNVQKKLDKSTNNDLQSITHKTKDRVTRTSLKTGDKLNCSGRVDSSCSTKETRRVTRSSTILKQIGKDISHKKPFITRLVVCNLILS